MRMNRPIQALGITLIALACAGFECSPAFPQDAQVAFDRALQAFRAGDNQKAAAILEENLKAHPDHAPSHELIGLAFSALGRSNEALQHLREALKLWPDQAVYWTNLSIFYLRESRRAEAEEALHQSLEVEPTPPAFRLLGLIRLDQHSDEKAVQLFSKALDLADDDVESWYYLGLAQQALAHSGEALRSYQEALKRAPGDFHTQVQMGTLLLTLGQRQDALVHLRAAREIRPQSPQVYRLLSEAYLGAGNLNQAFESGNHAVELTPGDRQAHYQLGLVLARMGHNEEAAKEFAISEGLPKKPEMTPLERWRELHSEGLRNNGSKP